MSRRKQPTKAQIRRWSIMTDIGCIACRIEGELRGEMRNGTPPDMHHLLEGYRKGHEFTVALCPWHHRAVPPQDMPGERVLFALERFLGPSLALSSKRFHARYGSDEELLEEQERLISEYLDNLVGGAGGEPLRAD